MKFIYCLSVFVFFYSIGEADASSLSCGNPQDDLSCMTCNCFNEAGEQSFGGQVAVGKVVQTRIYVNQMDRRAGRSNPRYKSTVCGVIKESKQFSWWDGVNRRRGNRQPVPSGHSCHRAAQDSLKFNGYFADHYHANYVSPRWRRGMKVVGNDKEGSRDRTYHIFYAAAGFKQTPRRENSPSDFNIWSGTVAKNNQKPILVCKF
jgi:spore germination cell wall hydrolase CwlJ-like protein